MVHASAGQSVRLHPPCHSPHVPPPSGRRPSPLTSSPAPPVVKRCYSQARRCWLVLTPTRRLRASATAAPGGGEDSWEDWQQEEETLGPAALATLSMLDWPGLCAQARRQRARCLFRKGLGPAASPAGRFDSASPPALRLRPQVSAFAQTTLGRRACQELLPAAAAATAQALLTETAAVDCLLEEYAVELDFGGIQTSQVG